MLTLANMASDIKDALKNKEFILHMQPQTSASKNKVVGFEVLLRWNNPKYSNISPQVYIEFAEKNGLMNAIGRFVVDETFRIAKQFVCYNIEISMNVSPAQLIEKDFVNGLQSKIIEYGVDPRFIGIEITETLYMTNLDYIVDIIKSIKKLGFKIHLDDFGTGYSSLAYLCKLPIDTIKIDKQFVTQIFQEKRVRHIISLISELGKRIGLNVIAEGIDMAEQKAILTGCGVDIIQGYLVGKAMPKEEAYKLIRKYNF